MATAPGSGVPPVTSNSTRWTPGIMTLPVMLVVVHIGSGLMIRWVPRAVGVFALLDEDVDRVREVGLVEVEVASEVSATVAPAHQRVSAPLVSSNEPLPGATMSSPSTRSLSMLLSIVILLLRPMRPGW